MHTHINCTECKASLGDLITQSGVEVHAIILTCPKCGFGMGGYHVGDPKKVSYRRSGIGKEGDGG